MPPAPRADRRNPNFTDDYDGLVAAVCCRHPSRMNGCAKMTKVALLGLGKMGSGMARRLAASGHDVAVWNRTRDKAEVLAAEGMLVASTPADAAHNAAAIVSMVADDEASRRVWLEADGALAAAKPGALAIECSTLSYAHVIELAEKIKTAGLRFIDSPVNGGPTAAAEGRLTLLVGASASDLEVARPLLSAISSSVLYLGQVGTGTAIKLINNVYGAVQIAGLAEAVSLATRIGLEKEVMIAAIESGPCASPHVKRLARGMVERRIADVPGLSIGLREKDARYALAMAHGLSEEMPVCETAYRWYALAKPTSGAEDDSALIRTVLSFGEKV